MKGEIHTVPVGDLREHVTGDGELCPCLPCRDAEAELHVIHNSYDRREVHEVALRALDELGLIVAGYDHTWSPSQRQLYERAVYLLKGGPCCSREIDQELLGELL